MHDAAVYASEEADQRFTMFARVHHVEPVSIDRRPSYGRLHALCATAIADSKRLNCGPASETNSTLPSNAGYRRAPDRRLSDGLHIGLDGLGQRRRIAEPACGGTGSGCRAVVPIAVVLEAWTVALMAYLLVPCAAAPWPSDASPDVAVRRSPTGTEYHLDYCTIGTALATLTVPAVIMVDLVAARSRVSSVPLCRCVDDWFSAQRALAALEGHVQTLEGLVAKLKGRSGDSVPATCDHIEREAHAARSFIAQAGGVGDGDELGRLDCWLDEVARYGRGRREEWSDSIVVTREVVTAHLGRLHTTRPGPAAAAWHPVAAAVSTAIVEAMAPLLARTMQKSDLEGYAGHVSQLFLRAAVQGKERPDVANVQHPWLRPLQGTLCVRSSWTPNMIAQATRAIDQAWQATNEAVQELLDVRVCVERWVVVMLPTTQSLPRDIIASYPQASSPTGALLLSVPQPIARALLLRAFQGKIVCQGKYDRAVLETAWKLNTSDLTAAVTTAALVLDIS